MANELQRSKKEDLWSCWREAWPLLGWETNIHPKVDGVLWNQEGQDLQPENLQEQDHDWTQLPCSPPAQSVPWAKKLDPTWGTWTVSLEIAWCPGSSSVQILNHWTFSSGVIWSPGSTLLVLLPWLSSRETSRGRWQPWTPTWCCEPWEMFESSATKLLPTMVATLRARGMDQCWKFIYVH